MQRITRAYLEEQINKGFSVYVGGKICSKIDELPEYGPDDPKPDPKALAERKAAEAKAAAEKAAAEKKAAEAKAAADKAAAEKAAVAAKK